MSRMRGRCAITSSNVPCRCGSSLAERGNISYQLEKRAARLDVDREGRRVVRDERAVAQRRERVGERRRTELREPRVGRRVLEFGDESFHLRERARIARIGELERGREQQLRFVQFERHVLAGRVFLRDIVDERGPVVAPGNHAKFMAAEPVERDAGVPAVVRFGFERDFAPVVVAGGAPLQRGREMRVPVGEDRCVDDERLADHALDREAAAVDRRLDALDRDPFGRERRGQRAALVCGSWRVVTGGARHACSSAYAPGSSVNGSSAAGGWVCVPPCVATCVNPPGTPGRIVAGSTVTAASSFGIQRDQQRRVVVFERRPGAAQQRGRRCAGCAQLHDFAARGTGVARRHAFASAIVPDRSKRARSNAAR